MARIAILSDWNTDFLREPLERGLHDVFTHPYGQWMQIIESGALRGFGPEYVLILVDNFPISLANLREKIPDAWLLYPGKMQGNLWDRSLVNHRMIEDLAAWHVHIVDMEQLAMDLDADWYDPRLWYTARCPWSAQAINAYTEYINAFIRLIEQGRQIKVIILDLDNTLWDGIIGEGAIEFPEWRLDFQHELLRQRELGVILCVASRNNPEDALAGLNDPRCLIKPEHITVMEVGWDKKSLMVGRIKRELEVKNTAVLFWDDQAQNRWDVVYHADGIHVAGEKDAVYWPRELANHPGLRYYTLTATDMDRAASYTRNQQRKAAQQQVENLDDYLHQLRIELEIRLMQPADISRVQQLAQRTTQFNLNGLPYDATEGPTYVASYRDCYGDEGIISAFQLHARILWRWWLSCRVLGRGVEDAIWRFIRDEAVGQNFRETDRNQVIREFYQREKQDTPWIKLTTPS
jgi:FkbH-like protein